MAFSRAGNQSDWLESVLEFCVACLFAWRSSLRSVCIAVTHLCWSAFVRALQSQAFRSAWELVFLFCCQARAEPWQPLLGLAGTPCSWHHMLVSALVCRGAHRSTVRQSQSGLLPCFCVNFWTVRVSVLIRAVVAESHQVYLGTCFAALFD